MGTGILKAVWEWLKPKLPKDVTSWVILFFLLVTLIGASVIVVQVFFRGYKLTWSDGLQVLPPIAPKPIFSGPAVPVGTIIAYYGDIKSIPKGFELCNGDPVSTPDSPLHISANPDFRKPNLSGRFILGAKSNAKGITDLHFGGSSSITLQIDNLPQHQHSLPYPRTKDDIEQSNLHDREYIGTGDNRLGEGKTGLEGKGTPFSILPPFYEVFFIIRVL